MISVSWTITFKNPKTGRIASLANPTKRHKKAGVNSDGKAAAILNITYNYYSYYYEAGEGDKRFNLPDKINAGLRALEGKSSKEAALMIRDMIKRIRSRYQNADGSWQPAERHMIIDSSVSGQRTRIESYWVSEGDTSDYYEATAANAIEALNQLLYLAEDCGTKNAVISIQ